MNLNDPSTKLLFTVAQANQVLDFMASCRPPRGADNGHIRRGMLMIEQLQPLPEPKQESGK